VPKYLPEVFGILFLGRNEGKWLVLTLWSHFGSFWSLMLNWLRSCNKSSSSSSSAIQSVSSSKTYNLFPSQMSRTKWWCSWARSILKNLRAVTESRKHQDGFLASGRIWFFSYKKSWLKYYSMMSTIMRYLENLNKGPNLFQVCQIWSYYFAALNRSILEHILLQEQRIDLDPIKRIWWHLPGDDISRNEPWLSWKPSDLNWQVLLLLRLI